MLIMYNYGWITLKLTAKAVGAGGRSPSQSILKPVLEKIDTGACLCYYKVFISMRNCVKFWPGFSSLDPTTWQSIWGVIQLHSSNPTRVVMYNVFYGHWGNVVKPILDALGYSSVKCTFADDSSNPHCPNQLCIWWCSTGTLAFLPIHIAGIYGQGRTPAGSGFCISDYVVVVFVQTTAPSFSFISSVAVAE